MFGAPNPAAAPAGGFSFSGGGAPAPAFGSNPAPAPFGSPAPVSAFGTNPAPAPFGTPGPAPAFGGGFGAPAPAFGAPAPGGFGGSPAPAFGAPAPGAFGSAPASSSLFGGSPAPAPFGSSAPAPFGSPAPAPFGAFGGAAQQQQQQQQPTIAGNMRYTDLPPHHRNAIDQIYNLMMQHKRTMLQVHSSGPSALQQQTVASPGDAVVKAKAPLPARVDKLKSKLDRLQLQIDNATSRANECKQKIEDLTQQGYMYGKWPLEAVATRRGLRLPAEEKKSESDATNARMREILDQAVSHVDRLERMPSPYFWKLLNDFERRIEELQGHIDRTFRQLEQQQLAGNEISVATRVEDQYQALWATADGISKLSESVEQLRQRYSHYERPGENVLDKARAEELQREQRLNESIQRMYVQAAAAPAQAPAPGGFGAPAPSPFGAAPAPSGFGSTPAPSSSAFSFSSAPTPAPFSLGGSAAAPAPFGTAAPAFGSAPSGAPAFGTAPAPGAFGSTGFGATTPTPSTPQKNKKGSRSSGRLKR